MRVLIADDEAPARERLRQLLAAHPRVEVIAEAQDGTEAIQLAVLMKPDLLFLDVQMPGATGLDVAACLRNPRPAIIFCTAFDQHAVDAFELNAVDYLLKPVSRARLAESLRRVCQIPDVSSARRNGVFRDPHRYVRRFLVKHGPHHVVVPVKKTASYESIDGLTRMTMLDGQVYWIDPSLQELEAQLDPNHFYRVSRSSIIAIGEILELHPLPGGSAEIALTHGVRFEVSRRRVRPLISLLEKGYTLSDRRSASEPPLN